MRAFFLGVVAALWGTGDPAVAQSVDEQAALEALFPISEDAGPGFVLQVLRPDHDPLTITRGFANLEHSVAISEQTAFHIASLSKQITAGVLAVAILEARVSLDDPLSRWVPEAAHWGGDLTLAHLVYMTSGIPEYYDLDRASGQPWSTHYFFTPDEAIETVLAQADLRFEPGSQWRYSNINYMLLAEVVERAYGQPFSQVAHDTLFTPLGMEQTLIHDDITQLIPGRADAYMSRREETVQEFNGNIQNVSLSGSDWMVIRRNAPHYGGSGVVTSMADWSKWMSDMASHTVLGDAFWGLMLRTQAFDHDKINDGLGLVLSDYEGRPMVWYEGGDIDVSSYMIYFLDEGLSLSCFANNPEDTCRDKVQAVVGLLRNEY